MAFAPSSSRPARCGPLSNQFGTDADYPSFLPQGGIGGAGPMPEDDITGAGIFDGPMGWDREAYSTVSADLSQLDSAFMAGTGALLDAKLEGYSEAEKAKLLEKNSVLDVLNLDKKKIEAAINPPPPKEKKAAAKKEAPAKKAAAE